VFRSELSALPRPELFEFVERARPVFAQQAAQRAVGQEFAAGLAACAVVGFVRGVTDALDFGAAARARFAITSVDGHVGTKRRDLLGKFIAGFVAKFGSPESERAARGFVKAGNFLIGQAAG